MYIFIEKVSLIIRLSYCRYNGVITYKSTIRNPLKINTEKSINEKSLLTLSNKKILITLLLTVKTT